MAPASSPGRGGDRSRHHRRARARLPPGGGLLAGRRSAGARLRLSEASGVHLMVSGQYALSKLGPPYPGLFQVTRRFAESYGSQRMLWASDYPWTRDVPGYRTLLDVVPAALPDLDADGLAWVLGGTARALFPHLASEPNSDKPAPPP